MQIVVLGQRSNCAGAAAAQGSHSRQRQPIDGASAVDCSTALCCACGATHASSMGAAADIGRHGEALPSAAHSAHRCSAVQRHITPALLPLFLLVLLSLLLTLQEKAALKAEKDAAEAKYKVAYVDGRAEQVRAAATARSGQGAAAAVLQQMQRLQKQDSCSLEAAVEAEALLLALRVCAAAETTAVAAHWAGVPAVPRPAHHERSCTCSSSSTQQQHMRTLHTPINLAPAVFIALAAAPTPAADLPATPAAAGPAHTCTTHLTIHHQVGNFRVEPPSLFRGRGEHPKMGKIKQRVYPRDITINIGQQGQRQQRSLAAAATGAAAVDAAGSQA